ncbi:ABC transporter ATP-binding protein, partial [Paenisporosarcina sp.]|uniref:ABC transporter ATP-binding protein n=1 Tax=Paenisporosarcina sp. TaxID=1932001 RepID=UPI003C77FF86
KARGIEDITFQVAEGEIFGFIGPNGSGKSTTIRTLLNFLYPTSGSAKILGKDVVKDSKYIRQHIGYLPSEVHYYDDMKVNELFRFSSGFYSGNAEKHALLLAQRLQLDTTRKIEDLSFGNKKKVGIIQALMHEPKLLILDEPTAGLDPLMQSIFFDLLKELQQKGTTIFFSSHYLGEVQKLCDRVGIIKEGRMIKIENMEDMRANQFKKVHLHFHGKWENKIQIQGVFQEHITDTSYDFIYNGHTRELLEQLRFIPFDDVTIEEPSLEEVFMHYYEKEEGEHHGL